MSHKMRFVFIVAVVLLLAGAGVYVRRKARADAAAAVQLGLRDGAAQDLSASEPGVSAVQAAAAQVRAAFQDT